MYKVIDLFAGAGGLSLGFEQTRKYEIKVAFENNITAQETYKKNHPNTEVLDDVCDADYEKLKKKYGKIDIVIGGPPCQGFSNANRQKNYAINKNNMLLKQYIRAIIELQPDAFVMENVSMLTSHVHRFYMEHSDKKIVEEYKIPTEYAKIFLLNERYKFNGAKHIIQSPLALQHYIWTPEIYATINIAYKQNRNINKLKDILEKHKKTFTALCSKIAVSGDSPICLMNENLCSAFLKYYSGIFQPQDLINAIEPPIMIQRMLGRAKEILDNNLLVDHYSDSNDIVAHIKSFAISDYLNKILSSTKHGYVVDSGVLCAADFGAPQKRMRFVLMGVKSNINSQIALPKGHIETDKYFTVYDAISDLEKEPPIMKSSNTGQKFLYTPSIISPLASQLRDSNVLYNHIITNSSNIALERFKVIKQGQNFHSLSEEMKKNTYTDSSRTQNTIYLRLSYFKPSGTVVNVRKSMWIHPIHNRAISVREAARLQTFPDSFIFTGSKDAQYQQVGNAVPPMLAKAIAEKLYCVLQKTSRENCNG